VKRYADLLRGARRDQSTNEKIDVLAAVSRIEAAVIANERKHYGLSDPRGLGASLAEPG